jgi:hypothetical protein
VEDIIKRTLPTTAGQRNGCLFDLARGLKHNCGLADASFATLKPLVRRWHALALPYIDTKAFDASWSDFVRQWNKANIPLDVDVEGWAFAQAKECLPPAAAEYDTPEVKLLVGICWHMSSLNPAGRFYLSSHKAGGLLAVSHDRALSWLRMFCADGILEITERGNERRATRYRYLPEDNEKSENQ